MNGIRQTLAAATILAAAAACGAGGATSTVAADRAATAVTTHVSTPVPARTAPTSTPPAPAAVTVPDGGAAVGPGTVALAVTITLASIDTQTDTNPADAYRRAAPWIEPTLLSGILATPQRVAAAWLDLTAHRGYTYVTAQLANEYGQPADTPGVAYETVTYTVHTAHRDETPPPTASDGVRRMRLTNTAGGWKVEAFLP